MKELLLVDCCVRGKESRTRKLVDAFLEGLDPKKFHVTRISPEAEGLLPLAGANFAQREKLVADVGGDAAVAAEAEKLGHGL